MSTYIILQGKDQREFEKITIFRENSKTFLNFIKRTNKCGEFLHFLELSEKFREFSRIFFGLGPLKATVFFFLLLSQKRD